LHSGNQTKNEEQIPSSVSAVWTMSGWFTHSFSDDIITISCPLDKSRFRRSKIGIGHFPDELSVFQQGFLTIGEASASWSTDKQEVIFWTFITPELSKTVVMRWGG
jgi:hypothetical protein